MVKKAIFLAVALAAVSSTYAQESRFGIRAGLNLASIEVDEKGAPAYDNTIGFHVGIIADIGINELFYFQPGLLFSAKGAEYSNESYTSSGIRTEYELTASAYYLEIPLMASVKMDINESLALRLNAGPYIGFGITGTIEEEFKVPMYPQYNESDSENVFKKGGFKRLDFGIAFGSGLEFQNFYIGVNYGIGLNDVSDGYTNADIYNRCLGITLGYNF
jgi:hypothetical protein